MKKPETLKIALNGIQLYGYHGVSELEQVVGNNFRIQLHLDVVATESALKADKLDGTVNYAEVYRHVKEVFSVSSHLLENVAWRIVCDLFHSFPLIQAINVTIEKINPPMGADCSSASVTLEMKR